MPISKKTLSLLVVLCAIFQVNIAKGSEIIDVTHKYIMGDNDSKNDARKMCFLEAKRKALEKAGTYIQSLTEIQNSRLTKDEILAYSAALVKIETIKEDWKFEGNHMVVILKVKVDIDTHNLKKNISQILGDKKTQKSILDQQGKINELERKVLSLQKALGTVDADKASNLRKNRNVAFKKIDKLEEKKIEIHSYINSISKDAIKYIERGMTVSEVIGLLGPARSEILSDYNYGNVWVIFKGNIVGCIVSNNCYRSFQGCGWHSHYSNCVVK
jgi:hypothetical protein